jgi:hypothetical protein
MPNSVSQLRRWLAATALVGSLAIGLAATAAGAPVGDDFWECVADHQDTDGIGVCCVFYGGDYDERTGECWIEHELAPAEPAGPAATPPITVRPEVVSPSQVLEPATSRAPVQTPVSRVLIASMG